MFKVKKYKSVICSHFSIILKKNDKGWGIFGSIHLIENRFDRL